PRRAPGGSRSGGLRLSWIPAGAAVPSVPLRQPSSPHRTRTRNRTTSEEDEMVGDVYGPADQVGSLLRRDAARWWWVPSMSGLAWLVIGWAVLRADVVS